MAHLTTKQVMAGFNTSDMTVYTWRKGTTTRDPLPCTVDGRKVTFKDTDMKAWAKKYNLTFSLEAALKVAGAAVPTGPKPKTAIAAKKVGKSIPVVVEKVKAKVAAVVETAKRATPVGKKAAQAASDAMQAAKGKKTKQARAAA